MNNEVALLVDEIISINQLQKRFIESILPSLTPDDLSDLTSYLRYCLSLDYKMPYLAQCYNLVVEDMRREQLFFKRNKRYRNSSFDDVASTVYFNDGYMSRYMIGLALTGFFWPNHLAMTKFFLETIPKDDTGKYLEVGPGHGLYFMNALRNTSYSEFQGVDISPSSVRMTKEVLESGFFGELSNFNIVQSDFLKMECDCCFNAIVMGEVLEHVENPCVFLDKLYAVSADDAYMFVSTCINSPAIDHIYWYRSLEQIREQIESMGFQIAKSLSLPYCGTTLGESEEQGLPINVALILSKK